MLSPEPLALALSPVSALQKCILLWQSQDTEQETRTGCLLGDWERAQCGVLQRQTPGKQGPGAKDQRCSAWHQPPKTALGGLCSPHRRTVHQTLGELSPQCGRLLHRSLSFPGCAGKRRWSPLEHQPPPHPKTKLSCSSLFGATGAAAGCQSPGKEMPGATTTRCPRMSQKGLPTEGRDPTGHPT